MDAKALNCPNCGAASDLHDTKCRHCGSALATISCPSCFALAFRGAEFCQACGNKLARLTLAEAEGACPRCQSELNIAAVGDIRFAECARCHGLWTDSDSFRRICTDRERQSLLLGSVAKLESISAGADFAVRYAKCPRCSQLMNRVNFSKCSGVIIDICREHGVWFDANELQRIVEFIRTGGLEVARRKEKESLEEELRRLRQERELVSTSDWSSAGRGSEYGIDLIDIFGAAGALLSWLKDR